jgi:hypothetical protein
VVTLKAGAGYALELGFASEQPLRFDLRPVLPLVFRSFP